MTIAIRIDEELLKIVHELKVQMALAAPGVNITTSDVVRSAIIELAKKYKPGGKNVRISR